MKTAVIYTRVSTDEQAIEGRSLSDQLTTCKESAGKRDFSVMKEFTDEGISGSSDRRPGLHEMIAYCQTNKINHVMITDTDRLARKESLHFAIKASLYKSGTTVIAVNQPMLDDSPEGSFMDSILAAVNAFQPKITGRKVKTTMELKAKSGWKPGEANLGYLNVTDPYATDKLLKRIIDIDHVKGPLISKMFKLYATGGYSLIRLADQMYIDGLRTTKG